MRSFPDVAKDVLNQLSLSNERRRTDVTPIAIYNQAIQTLDLGIPELTEIKAKRERNLAAIALGTGAAAYVLVQIGNYFSENPQTLYTLGEGIQAIFDNWETLTAIWQVGSFVGFEHIWSAIEATTHVTQLAFDYGIGDLIDGVAHALDFYSLGAAIAATLITKGFFKWLNKEKKAELEDLVVKLRKLNKIASLAEKAAPPSFLRREIATLGSHHFAY
jgi:hypothetical protein